MEKEFISPWIFYQVLFWNHLKIIFSCEILKNLSWRRGSKLELQFKNRTSSEPCIRNAYRCYDFNPL